MTVGSGSVTCPFGGRPTDLEWLRRRLRCDERDETSLGGPSREHLWPSHPCDPPAGPPTGEGCECHVDKGGFPPLRPALALHHDVDQVVVGSDSSRPASTPLPDASHRRDLASSRPRVCDRGHQRRHWRDAGDRRPSKCCRPIRVSRFSGPLLGSEESEWWYRMGRGHTGLRSTASGPRHPCPRPIPRGPPHGSRPAFEPLVRRRDDRSPPSHPTDRPRGLPLPVSPNSPDPTSSPPNTSQPSAESSPADPN
jgi:hypothetical protein